MTTAPPLDASPFALRPYRRYLAGTTVFSFGNGVQFVANSWLALQLGGGSFAVAMTLVCLTVPGIVFGPAIGVLVDRMDRRRLAAAVSLLRAAALCLMPVVAAVGTPVVWHVYLTSAFIGLADKVYRPATLALLREVMPVRLLLRANSAAAVGTQLGAAGGAGAAGLMALVTSPVTMRLGIETGMQS